MGKKILYIVFFVLSCAFHGRAQNAFLDSLQQWLANNVQRQDSNYCMNLHRVSFRLAEINPGKAISIAKEVVKLADSLHWLKGKCLGQINYALVYSAAGSYEASNLNYAKAIVFADSAKWLRGKSICLNNIGDNYRELKEYKSCIEYAIYALKVNKDLKEARGQAINQELMGTANFYLNNPGLAMEHFRLADQLSRLADDERLISQIWLGLSKTHFKLGNLDSGKLYMQKVLAISEKNNEKTVLQQAYLHLGISLESIIVDSAKYYLLKSLSIADSINYFKGKADVYEALSDWMRNKGLHDSALTYYKLFKAIEDSLTKQKLSRGVLAMEGFYKVRSKEEENAELKTKTALQEKELSSKNRFLLVLGIAATLGFISLILLYLFARQRRQQFLQEKQKQAAEMKNQTLQLELKALRAQMNPHFIFNCMNTIDAYILRQQPMEASGILQKFSKLIRNVLENSELQLIPLTQDADTNRNYIDLEQTIYKHKFVYELTVDEGLRQNPPLIPPMLVQPFIENAILHGLRHLPNGNGRLLVHYQKVDGHVRIVIEDNGIGRAKSGKLQKLHSSNSMGMQVTESRMNALKELHGIDLHVQVEDATDSDTQPGTKVILQL